MTIHMESRVPAGRESQAARGKAGPAPPIAKTELEHFEVLGFSYLWRCLSPKEKPSTHHNALKVIYRRLQAGEDPGIIIPDTITNISTLLTKHHLPPQTKALLCHVLRLLFINDSFIKLFVKFGLFKILIELAESWLIYNKSLTEAESLFYASLLALFEFLTSKHSIYKRELIELGLLSTLCGLCAHHCRASYDYGSDYYTSLNDWTLGVYPGLMGKLAAVHPDLQREAYTDTLGDDFTHFLLPDEVYLVDLYNTTDPELDVNIADKMKELQVAWPTVNELVPSLTEDSLTVSSTGEEWKNIYVTSFTEGSMFWAQVDCSETFKIIGDISHTLEQWPHKSGLSEAPEVGSILVVNHEDIGYSRFQVMEFVTHDVVRARALDYGSVIKIPWRSESVFEIEPEMDLDTIPPQACLCILKGVSPPPLDPPTLQRCVGIIRNLGTEAAIYHQNMYFGPGLIRTLQILSACPEPVLVRAAAQATYNIYDNDIMKAKLLSTDTLDVLLGTLERFRRSQGGEVYARAIYSTLTALTRIMHDCHELKNAFAQKKGLHSVLRLLNYKDVHSRVRNAATKLLVVFIGAIQPYEVVECVKKRKPLPAPNRVCRDVERAVLELGVRKNINPFRVNRGGARNIRECRPPTKGSDATSRGKYGATSGARYSDNSSDALGATSRCRTSARHTSAATSKSGATSGGKKGKATYSATSSTEDSNSELDDRPSWHQERSRAKIRSLFGSEGKEAPLCTDRYQDDSDLETGDCVLSSVVGRASPRFTGESSDGELLSTLSKSLTSESDGESGVCLLKTSSVYNYLNKKPVYVQGRKVSLSNDLNYDMRPYESVERISKSQIIMSAISLLNTGEGGKIYIGLDLDGEVSGITMGRAQKDGLRLSLDKLLFNIRPPLTALNYIITYHEVVDETITNPAGEVGYTAITDHYVVEIEIKPVSVDQVYTTMKGEIYMRTDNGAEEVSLQELCRCIVVKEEKRKLAIIEDMKKQLDIWQG